MQAQSIVIVIMIFMLHDESIEKWESIMFGSNRLLLRKFPLSF